MNAKIIQKLFEKTDKPITSLDHYSEQIADFIEKLGETNIAARERAQRFGGERDKLAEERNVILRTIEAQKAEYKKLLEEERKAEQEQIRKDSITKDDLDSGRISFREYAEFRKTNEAIEAEAREAAREKMKPLRESIRKNAKRVLMLNENIAELDLKISRNVSGGIDHLIFKIDGLKEQLRRRGFRYVSVESANALKKEALNERYLAEGMTISHIKTWEIKSPEELDLLFCDPVIQEKHFANLAEEIGKIKGMEFSSLRVSYSPSDFGNRFAGDFDIFIRSKRG